MKTSNIWYWFSSDPDDNNYAICFSFHCRSQTHQGRIKLPNGGSTACKKHLLLVHKIDCEKDSKKDSSPIK